MPELTDPDEGFSYSYMRPRPPEADSPPAEIPGDILSIPSSLLPRSRADLVPTPDEAILWLLAAASGTQPPRASLQATFDDRDGYPGILHPRPFDPTVDPNMTTLPGWPHFEWPQLPRTFDDKQGYPGSFQVPQGDPFADRFMKTMPDFTTPDRKGWQRGPDKWTPDPRRGGYKDI